jgi:WD40 repeat protein
LKVFKPFQFLSKVFLGSTFLLYLLFTLILISSPTFESFEAEATEVSSTLTETDLESMGVQWTYKRPDTTEEGPATSWKLRWSPDGTKIAVVYFDNTTIILDSSTGKLIQVLGSGAAALMGETTDGGNTRCWGFTANPMLPLLRAVAWSPDGGLLAIAGDHTLIEIFDTKTWEQKYLLTGHTGSVLSLDWSPNGRWLASGEGTDRVLEHNEPECKNVIKIWDIETGTEQRTLTGHKDGVLSLRWSSNSSRLVSSADDKDIRIWDPINGTLLYILGEGRGHSSGVLDVDWSPDQTKLVSGSRDYKVRLWNANNGTPLGKPWKDHNCVRSTHWHPGAKYILTAGVDQTIKIRNASSGKEIKIFEEALETNSEVMSARWSPDGNKIAACSTRDGAVRLYAIGFDTGSSSETTVDWRVGITIFAVVIVVGLVLIYIPLRNEFREHRK